MDEEKLVNLWNEYQSKKDTYTPEQQEAMENKFWALVERAIWEKETQREAQIEELRRQQFQQQLYQQAVAQAQQQAKASKPKDNRVTL